MSAAGRGVTAALLVAALAAGSCNILGPAAYLVYGPPRTDAVYKLTDRPTVVFVDDRANTIPRQSDGMCRTIADQVSRELMKKNVLTTTIRPGDAIGVARRYDRYGDVLSIDAIGEAVKAEQVIYVQMVDFSDTPDGVTPRPQAACEVKVIDVAGDTRLFPPADAAAPTHAVRAALPFVDEELYSSSSGRLQIYRQLAEELGSQVAKLFYSHETKELGGQLDPR